MARIPDLQRSAVGEAGRATAGKAAELISGLTPPTVCSVDPVIDKGTILRKD
jgi:hypothetical protein